MHPLAQLDHAHVWHPFTQMREWMQQEPIIITEGEGAVLRDVKGKEYLDANSSIWTNLHGHKHPEINGAIEKQLGKIAHSSALGLANEPASVLAERLTQAANRNDDAAEPQPRLNKVFFSDDGSTAMEAGLKMVYEFSRRERGIEKPTFLSLGGAYHGDTIGAVSLGHIELFHKSFGRLLFESERVMAPYCYRCPFNQAKPERADAREYRKCEWECVGKVEEAFGEKKRTGEAHAAFVVEPLMQGAAGMIPQPTGWLRKVSALAREAGTLLFADEVMTGFGRTGVSSGLSTNGEKRGSTIFACHQESVQPDIMAVAKGLTGGYLPMAATLVSEPLFEAFLGEYSEFKTFFHGHSYTGNQLGAAAALKSLEILESEKCVRERAELQAGLREELARLWEQRNVGDIRQVGLICGVELVKDWRTRESFAPADKAGIRVCAAMAERGVLTRPVGDVVVIMPPYCTSREQLNRIVQALMDSLQFCFHS